MEKIEDDIGYWSKYYHIPGYEAEDLAQELRIQLLLKEPKFNPEKSAYRTWANYVMKNKMIDLLRKHKNEIGLMVELRVSDNPTPGFDELFEILDDLPDKTINIWDYL
jgi:RNA polymerase sigma factor (sigma-70 family)